MISSIDEFTDSILSFDDLSKSEMIDYFIFYLTEIDGREGATAKSVEGCFDELKILKYSNISSYLSRNSKRSRGKDTKLIKQNGAYCLSRARKTEVEAHVSSDKPKLIVNQSLRQLIDQITDPGEREFLDEAIKTFEVAAYRASIIMVWLLSLDHLFAYIIAEKLNEFNIELAKVTDRRVKVSAVATKDDFSEIPEGKFIEICRAAKIITNDVRKILDVKLGIRNSYAHPSTVKLPKSKALEFVEDLVTNVILKY